MKPNPPLQATATMQPFYKEEVTPGMKYKICDTPEATVDLTHMGEKTRLLSICAWRGLRKRASTTRAGFRLQTCLTQ
jgi:hypothetical protein